MVLRLNPQVLIGSISKGDIGPNVFAEGTVERPWSESMGQRPRTCLGDDG